MMLEDALDYGRCEIVWSLQEHGSDDTERIANAERALEAIDALRAEVVALRERAAARLADGEQ